MTAISRSKIISQESAVDLTPTNSRLTNLENNVYKITYYEIVSGTSGSLTIPSQATINADEFGLSGNAILSKIDGFNKPTFQSPTTSTGVVVTTSLNTTTGAWAVSGAYTDAFVAVIYSINIKAVYYSNLTYSKIIETVDAGVAHLDSPNFTGVPTAPTATAGTNTTQLATTAFVLANPATGTILGSLGTTGIGKQIPFNSGVANTVTGSDNITAYNVAATTSIILNNPSTSQVQGVSFYENGNGGFINRYGSALTASLFAGTNFAKSNTLTLESGNALTYPIFLMGTPIINGIGTVGTNGATRLDAIGLRIGTMADIHTANTAKLQIGAGSATANTAPIKLTSGVLMTTAEVGAIEFLNDALYATITTGAIRKQVAFTSDITGTNSGTNTGDNANNTQYASDYRLANFVAGTNYLAPNGSAAALTSFPILNQSTTGNASTATNLTGLTTTVATLNNTSGVNTGDETAARIATINHSATVKSVLVDADELTGQDSASAFSLIRTTLLNIFTYIQKKFETKTLIGDAAYSILASDNVIMTSVALTLPRIWTLPSASSVNAGNEKIFDDAVKAITATNTITVAVQTGQYLNNVLNGTDIIGTPGAHRRLIADGVNNWTFDAGIARLSETQTLLAKTLVTPVIGSITGVSGAIQLGTTETINFGATNQSLQFVPTATTPTFTQLGSVSSVLKTGSGTRSITFSSYATDQNYLDSVGGALRLRTLNANNLEFWTNNLQRFYISGIDGSITPAFSSSGAGMGISIAVQPNTNQTLSTNIPNFKVAGNSKQWATGAITNQYWNYLSANSASFVGASIITNSYGLFVEPATASTNATITNNYALGLGGGLEVQGFTKLTASVTAVSALARAVVVTPTLIASANNDILVGLDINPTFTNGAFTGVKNVGLRVNTGQILAPDGTNALPTYSFSSDPATGINAAGFGAMALVTGGVTGLYINGSGFRFSTGRAFADSQTGNAWLKFTAVNATGNDPNNNYFSFLNGGTTVAPQITATGTDANINFVINAKGTGRVVLNGGITGTASTTASSSLNMPSGVAPTTPVNGDVWNDGTNLKTTSLGVNQTILKGVNGSFSVSATAQTAFVVTFGGTQPNATYQVFVTPTNALSAASLYVVSKTTTTFTVTFLTGLTGTVSFDWGLIQ